MIPALICFSIIPNVVILYVVEDFEWIEGVSLLKTFSNWTLDRTNAGLYTRRAKAPDRGGSRPQGSKPVTSSRMKKGKRRKEKKKRQTQFKDKYAKQHRRATLSQMKKFQRQALVHVWNFLSIIGGTYLIFVTDARTASV